jgi:alpha/beta superfamily hydrolase
MISKDQLILGKTYYIYSFGGCIAMETIRRRKFVGLNLEGEPMFLHNNMGNITYSSDIWMFTQTPI